MYEYDNVFEMKEIVSSQLIPMEKFLSELSKKSLRRRLFNHDLERYFLEHPLSRDNCDRIIDLLKHHHPRKWDVIRSRFGIGTDKLTYIEYANKAEIGPSEAKHLYKSCLSFPRKVRAELHYLSMEQNYLRRCIFQTHFELKAMLGAHDRLADPENRLDFSLKIQRNS